MAAESSPPKYDDSNPFYKPSQMAMLGPHQKLKPLMYTPLTRWTEHWLTFADTPCARYENLWLKCAYQGSRKHMETRCLKEMEDLNECLYRPKQIARFIAIQTERNKQNKFENLPEADIFWERHAK